MATSIIDSLKLGENTGTLALPFGTCHTEANISAKTVDKAGFVLGTGSVIMVKFMTSNVASNPTLNVNGTGAKPIYQYGTTAAGSTTESSWASGSVVPLIYDGTGWIMASSLTASNIGDKPLGSVEQKTSNSWLLKFPSGSEILAVLTDIEQYDGTKTSLWDFSSDNSDWVGRISSYPTESGSYETAAWGMTSHVCNAELVAAGDAGYPIEFFDGLPDYYSSAWLPGTFVTPEVLRSQFECCGIARLTSNGWEILG